MPFYGDSKSNMRSQLLSLSLYLSLTESSCFFFGCATFFFSSYSYIFLSTYFIFKFVIWFRFISVCFVCTLFGHITRINGSSAQLTTAPSAKSLPLEWEWNRNGERHCKHEREMKWTKNHKNRNRNGNRSHSRSRNCNCNRSNNRAEKRLQNASLKELTAVKNVALNWTHMWTCDVQQHRKLIALPWKWMRFLAFRPAWFLIVSKNCNNLIKCARQSIDHSHYLFQQQQRQHHQHI